MAWPSYGFYLYLYRGLPVCLVATTLINDTPNSLLLPGQFATFSPDPHQTITHCAINTSRRTQDDHGQRDEDQTPAEEPAEEPTMPSRSADDGSNSTGMPGPEEVRWLKYGIYELHVDGVVWGRR